MTKETLDHLAQSQANVNPKGCKGDEEYGAQQYKAGFLEAIDLVSRLLPMKMANMNPEYIMKVVGPTALSYTKKSP